METTVHTLKSGREVNLRLIGSWVDLAKYWEGDDGNAWSSGVTGSLVNRGPIAEFRANFANRYRGTLTDGGV